MQCNKLHITAGIFYALAVALAHAILVSLSEQSGSGYELARRFDRSIGHFWSATHQQIYRTLQTMENAGWVTAKQVTQQGRPDKKVYTVAPPGGAELARWIAEAPAAARTAKAAALTDNRTRDLAVKLRGVGFGGPGALAAVCEQAKALRAQRGALLDTYRGYQTAQFPDPSQLAGNDLHHYLVLRGGIRAEQSTIAWLDEVLDALGAAQ